MYETSESKPPSRRMPMLPILAMISGSPSFSSMLEVLTQLVED